MRKLLAMFLSLAMVFSFAAVAAYAEEGEAAEAPTPVPTEKIPDEALYGYILNQVNLIKEENNEEKVEQLYYEDLDLIHYIEYAPEAPAYTEIADLTGIELCENINGIQLLDCEISSLAPLAELKNLQYLTLYNCGITSLEELFPIQEQLTELDISGNDLADASQLSGFSNLEYLQVAGCGIKSLEPFAELEKMEGLVVSDNEIKDISLLKDWSTPVPIDISNNLIDMGDADTLALLEELAAGGWTIVNSSQIPKDGYEYEKPFTIYWNMEEGPGFEGLHQTDMIIQKLNGEVIENQETYLIEEPGEYEYTVEINPNGIIAVAKNMLKFVIQNMIENGQDVKGEFPDFEFAGETPTEEEIDAYVDAQISENVDQDTIDELLKELEIANYHATFTIKGAPTPGGDTSKEEKPSSDNNSKTDDNIKPAPTADSNDVMLIAITLLSAFALAVLVINRNQLKNKYFGRHFR